MVGKNVQKFLTFVEDEPDFQGGPIPSKYLIPKKINLMVYTLFQVHTLKFNRKDYDTLSLFYLNRGYYNELSFPCPGTLSRNSECQAERQLYDAYFHWLCFWRTYCKESSEKHHKEIWVQFGTLHVFVTTRRWAIDFFCIPSKFTWRKEKSTQSGWSVIYAHVNPLR